MPRSVNSMMGSGAISMKAYNSTLAKTRAQKTKMAEFEHKGKDEGENTKGHIGRGEVDKRELQTLGTRERASGAPSKGGQARGGAVPGHNQINQAAMQKKKFPHGGHYVGKGNRTGPAGHIGVTHKPAQTGPMYGGGGRNTQ